MSRKFVQFSFILLLTIPFLSGCWDSLDMEKRATILGLAIDTLDEESSEQEDYITHFRDHSPIDDDKKIKLTAQVSVPGRIPLGPEAGSGGGKDQSPVWVLSTIGDTLDDALMNLQQELADELFLGHLRIVVLSEDIAEQGVGRFNEFLRRQPEVRRTTWIAISKEKAAKYMAIAPKLERVPTLYLTNIECSMNSRHRYRRMFQSNKRV